MLIYHRQVSTLVSKADRKKGLKQLLASLSDSKTTQGWVQMLEVATRLAEFYSLYT
jgi:hypothetical protein